MKVSESHVRVSLRRAYRHLGWGVALAVLAAVGGQPALAQTYTVPSGSSFAAAGVPAAPPAGSVISLAGNAILDSTLTLPSGTLSINGVGGTLTLTGAGLLAGSPATPIVNLTDITITGAPAGFIHPAAGTTGGVTVNTVGQVDVINSAATAITPLIGPLTIMGAAGSTITFDHNSSSYGGALLASNATITLVADEITLKNNQATTSGGAVYNSGMAANDTTVTIGAANSIITMLNNSAGTYGGAVLTNSGVTLTGSQITLTNNHAGTGTSNHGGAIYAGARAGSNLIVNGPLTASDNGAGGVGGVLFSSGPAPAGNITQDGGDVSMFNNTAGQGGGAIYSNSGNVSLATTSGNVSLTSNTGGQGGAIYTNAGNVTLGHAGAAVTLTGNRATIADGGAIEATGNVTITGAVDLSNNSTVAGGYGGAVDANGSFSLTATGDSTISNNSAGYGGALWVGRNLTLAATGGNITFSGNTQASTVPTANAIWMGNTGGGATALLDTAGGHTISLLDPIYNSVAGGLVTVTATGGGTVIFDQFWSPLYGATTVQGNTNFVVRNSAVYGELAIDASQPTPSSFTVASGATLSGGTAGAVRADNVTLAGTLNVPGAQTSSGNTFTIRSVSTDLTGATVRLNANLGALTSDRLILDDGGNIAGAATLQITNIGGLGAATTGDGILVVDAQGTATTAATTFALQGGAITAGGYTYELFRGGVNPATTPNSWYLRSTLAPSTSGSNAIPTLSPPVLALLALAMLAVAGLGRKRRA